MRGDIGDLRVAAHDHFVLQRHHRFERQLTVCQATNKNHHHAHMRKDVAQATRAARFGRYQRIAFGGLRYLEFPTLAGEMGFDVSQRCGCAQWQGGITFVVKGCKAFFARFLAKYTHFAGEFGCVAVHAQAGGNHQKCQNQQKPPSVVDRVEREQIKHREPELPKLVYVVVEWLVLL